MNLHIRETRQLLDGNADLGELGNLVCIAHRVELANAAVAAEANLGALVLGHDAFRDVLCGVEDAHAVGG